MACFPTRRSVALGVPALLCAGAALGRGREGGQATEWVAAIENRHGGRLGVFVLDTGSGRSLGHRADERFRMCSTFKGPLAAAILARVDAGRDDLAHLLPFSQKDLLPHSPVTSAHLGAGSLPIGALCAAILEQSDNAAANLLLAHVGGPAALTAYVRALGDRVTRFDRYEPFSNDGPGELDTTSPRAIVGLARAMLLGDALRPASRLRLERWMMRTIVGQTRLRASFPAGWTVADRTGTADGICNDFAIARPPNRPPLAMAAYYDAPGMQMEAQEAVLREIGSAILAWAG